jgi:hypothetical protein
MSGTYSIHSDFQLQQLSITTASSNKIFLLPTEAIEKRRQNFTWRRRFYRAEDNFWKDVKPLGNLLGRLSNKQ